MHGYAIAEGQRVMRSLGMPACPQEPTSMSLRWNEQRMSLCGLRVAVRTA